MLCFLFARCCHISGVSILSCRTWCCYACWWTLNVLKEGHVGAKLTDRWPLGFRLIVCVQMMSLWLRWTYFLRRFESGRLWVRGGQRNSLQRAEVGEVTGWDESPPIPGCSGTGFALTSSPQLPPFWRAPWANISPRPPTARSGLTCGHESCTEAPHPSLHPRLPLTSQGEVSTDLTYHEENVIPQMPNGFLDLLLHNGCHNAQGPTVL